MIRGYRTPGGHRRIFRHDLYRFLDKHGMPGGDRLDDQARVLVVSRNPRTVRHIEKALRAMDGRVTWTKAVGAFQVGMLLQTVKPDIIVADTADPEIDCAELCGQLKDDFETCRIEVVILADQTTGHALRKLRAAGAAKVMPQPVEPEQLQRVVESLLS